jgi:hypothetical protein
LIEDAVFVLSGSLNMSASENELLIGADAIETLRATRFCTDALLVVVFFPFLALAIVLRFPIS